MLNDIERLLHQRSKPLSGINELKHLAGKRYGERLADDSLMPHCADSINVFPLEFSNLYISITFLLF